MDEKRSRTRVDMVFGAVLHQGGRHLPVRLQNVSLKGAALSPDPRIESGRKANLDISLSGKESVKLQGEVVRADESGAAIEFTGMDEKSFGHLRNMVRLHSDDPDRIDDELVKGLESDL